MSTEVLVEVAMFTAKGVFVAVVTRHKGVSSMMTDGIMLGYPSVTRMVGWPRLNQRVTETKIPSCEVVWLELEKKLGRPRSGRLWVAQVVVAFRPQGTVRDENSPETHPSM